MFSRDKMLRMSRKEQLAQLSPEYAALEKERGRGWNVDMELYERQRALEKPLGWRLDAVARADETFGRELRRHVQQARRTIMSTFPSVSGPDPVLVEGTLAAACGKSTEEHEAMLRRLAGVRKVADIGDATTTDERLRCLRASVLELLQVQRYAFHLEVQYYEGEADRLCDNVSRMLAVLAPLLTLGALNILCN